jgi:hypothetical protein
MKINPEIVLVEVLKNGGCFNQEQAQALAEGFPTLAVCVKFGASLRQPCTMATVEKTILDRIAANPEHEYVREAYIVASECDRLRNERNIPDPYANPYPQKA